MATVSFTEISAFKRCRQQHAWRYRENLVSRHQAPHITLGTLCHAGMEAYWKNQSISDATVAKALEIMPAEAFDEEEKAYSDMAALASRVVRMNLPSPNWCPVPDAVEMEFDLRIPGSRHRVQGRIDSILREGDNLYVGEWKFPRSFKSEEDCQMSSQIAIYQWAALQLGYPVVGVLYTQILPKLPAKPCRNINGTTSRKEIYTDWRTYEATVREHGNDPADYLDMQEKLADKEFSRTYRIYRSKGQIDHYIKELRMVASDISATRTRVYPSENPVICSGCAYRDLCQEVARGRDPKHIIESSFVKRESHDTADTGGLDASDLPAQS